MSPRLCDFFYIPSTFLIDYVGLLMIFIYTKFDISVFMVYLLLAATSKCTICATAIFFHFTKITITKFAYFSKTY